MLLLGQWTIGDEIESSWSHTVKKIKNEPEYFFLSRCTSLLCRPLAFPPPPVHSLTTDNVNRKDEKKKKLLTNYIRRHRISFFFSIITKIKKKRQHSTKLFFFLRITVVVTFLILNSVLQYQYCFWNSYKYQRIFPPSTIS